MLAYHTNSDSFASFNDDIRTGVEDIKGVRDAQLTTHYVYASGPGSNVELDETLFCAWVRI